MPSKTQSPTPLRTAEDFLDFFQAIPEDQWITGQYIDIKSRCCAVGHLRIRSMRNGFDVSEAVTLVSILNISGLASGLGWGESMITAVNDGTCSKYPPGKFPTPKARICAMLKDIIAGPQVIS